MRHFSKDDSGNTVKNELEPETIWHISIEGDFGVIAVTLGLNAIKFLMFHLGIPGTFVVQFLSSRYSPISVFPALGRPDYPLLSLIFLASMDTQATDYKTAQFMNSCTNFTAFFRLLLAPKHHKSSLG